MAFLGNIAHDNYAPAKLVEVTLLNLGMIEISQAHLSTVVGRSNLDRCLEHKCTSTGEVNRRCRFLQAHVRAFPTRATFLVILRLPSARGPLFLRNSDERSSGLPLRFPV